MVESIPSLSNLAIVLDTGSYSFTVTNYTSDNKLNK